MSDALDRLAAELRGDRGDRPHVPRPRPRPPRSGCSPPRARAPPSDPGDYVLLFEAIREGYLLHYGDARGCSTSADPDLLLLAGDYLYALGLERLAERGRHGGGARARRPDQPLGPASRAGRRRRGRTPSGSPPPWPSATGTNDAYEEAKRAVRDGEPESERRLLEAALDDADEPASERALAEAADSIGFASSHLPDRG